MIPQSQSSSLQRLQHVEKRIVRVLELAGAVMEELGYSQGPRTDTVGVHCREFMMAMKNTCHRLFMVTHCLIMFPSNLNFTRVNMFCRCVDELESQLSKHGSLKKLYFYHQHLTTVFRNTTFGPEGRPQHCCAWLGAACSFPECASAIIPEEVNKIGRDSISYVESLIKSILGGLEGLINILDSEGGFGSLEMQMKNHNPLHSQIAEVKIDISASASVAAGNKLCKGAACYFSDSSNSSKDAKERSTSMRKLIIAVILCIIFMTVEVVGGIKANNLAILTDAAHLSDVAAFAIIVILSLGCWMGSNTTTIIWVLLD
ncbi:Protein NAP1 [Zea mays]|uniref:Protein NAP1 n=1 Tax=Zea mays TaxID=4577 RepID=A0A1D6P2H9_MAIZE|nr:Protein NAP1 [Zea mays]